MEYLTKQDLYQMILIAMVMKILYTLVNSKNGEFMTAMLKRYTVFYNIRYFVGIIFINNLKFSVFQSVGVICRVAGGKGCSNEEFECKSGECVPVRFLCDSYVDCTDGSDESPERCNVSPLTTPIMSTTSTTTKAPKKFIQKIAPKKKT